MAPIHKHSETITKTSEIMGALSCGGIVIPIAVFNLFITEKHIKPPIAHKHVFAINSARAAMKFLRSKTAITIHGINIRLSMALPDTNVPIPCMVILIKSIKKSNNSKKPK